MAASNVYSGSTLRDRTERLVLTANENKFDIIDYQSNFQVQKVALRRKLSSHFIELIINH